MQNPEPGYEELFARLQAVVAQLERGDMPLAESLRAYEEGVRLAAACQRLLDAAELRVQQLREGSGGLGLDPWDG